MSVKVKSIITLEVGTVCFFPDIQESKVTTEKLRVKVLNIKKDPDATKILVRLYGYLNYHLVFWVALVGDQIQTKNRNQAMTEFSIGSA